MNPFISILKSIGKTARDQLYNGIDTSNDKKSWKAKRKVCTCIVHGTAGVISNYIPLVKVCHPSYYDSYHSINGDLTVCYR